MPIFSEGRVLPAPSLAEREIGLSSKEHCTALTLIGDGPGNHAHAESYLELCHQRLLQVQPGIIALREQAKFRFGYRDEWEHNFDILATYQGGARIAYTVKPEVRLSSGRFLEEMQLVAYWVQRKKFADAVQLLTEADIDRTALHNAELLTSLRDTDPQADAIAREIASGFRGAVSLRDLTIKLDLKERGYRALLRLIRSGELALFARDRITPSTLVIWKGMTQ
ncbi:hypothetical protein [Acidimangrovimonas pyrenivorans]|uniref:Uncharacterized protein n=1 Tax=Acidimangrovimonas pyrenivorans TaxID=2030798 RepID=A0ABV7AML3_9RHOB